MPRPSSIWLTASLALALACACGAPDDTPTGPRVEPAPRTVVSEPEAPPPPAPDPCAIIPEDRTHDRWRCAQRVARPDMIPVPSCEAPDVPAEWRACEVDADCAELLLSHGCDRCNGGPALAVRRDRLDEARGRFPVDFCPERGCTEMICHDPPPVCRAGQCVFDDRPSGLFCSDDVPCPEGSHCAEATQACGGGMQCMGDGAHFIEADGCSWGMD